MIYGNISDLSSLSGFPEVLRKALKYLSSTDFESMEYGVYYPSEDFLVQVIDMTTKTREESRAEIHRKNLDIHFSLTGEETVYNRTSADGLQISESLFEERDIAFYNFSDREIEIPLSKGDYVVFFPGEVHTPGCIKGPASRIRKIVLKIDKTRLK